MTIVQDCILCSSSRHIKIHCTGHAVAKNKKGIQASWPDAPSHIAELLLLAYGLCLGSRVNDAREIGEQPTRQCSPTAG